jgi:hypothetical protein
LGRPRSGGALAVLAEAGHQHGSHTGGVADLLTDHPGLGLGNETAALVAAQNPTQTPSGSCGQQLQVGQFKPRDGLL